ncbi:MAG: transposase [Syntrophomonadaceae bacterium]|nr:transposase [Syntrophomonadaceae bacterium]
MVRQARLRCESGVYHVVLRGINRGDIFFDDDDSLRFLETLAQKKRNQEYWLYGYCLMNNHVHLLMKENKDTVSRTMSRIGTSYAKWYNQKYSRSGHVFQGRYGSECVEDDKYLLTVARYIHNNPVKAGLVRELEAYRWSSIHAYTGGRDYPKGLTETEFILSIFNRNRIEAIQAFREFMKQENEDICLDEEIKRKKTDGEVKAEIEDLMDGEPIGKLQGMEKEKRNAILRTIKSSEGVTLRQIARVTGLNAMNVQRA